MADLSSSISVPVASAQIGYQYNAQVNVANSGASDIVLLRIVPRIRETSNPFLQDATSRCKFHIDISKDPTIPAGGSKNYLMRIVFHAPSGTGTYDLSCDVYGTNGELVSPSAVTVTVTLQR